MATYQVPYYLKNALAFSEPVSKLNIYYPGYQPQVYFYMNRLHDERGIKTELLTREHLMPGMVVLSGKKHLEELSQTHVVSVLRDHASVVVFRIDSVRSK